VPCVGFSGTSFRRYILDFIHNHPQTLNSRHYLINHNQQQSSDSKFAYILKTLAAICIQYARTFGKLWKDKHMNGVNVYENFKR
jgi:hypothetical protein